MNETRHPLSFEEASAFLDEVAETIPEELLCELNGGIVLLPKTQHSPHGQGLYTLGTYHYDPYGLGRYITIHHGSFVRVHGRDSVEKQREALRQVLIHELTHHIESLAGVRDLEVKDERFIEKYKHLKKTKKV